MIPHIIILLLAAIGFGYVAKKIPVLPGGLRALIWFVLLLVTIFIATVIISALQEGAL